MTPTIYKVPMELKSGEKDESYEPVAVRVGPVTGSNKDMVLLKQQRHGAAGTGPITTTGNNNNSMVQLESYKWCCLQRLISSGGKLDLWLKSMKRLEPKIRASYSQDIELSSDDLAVNMLLDGCFILHRLLKYTRLGEEQAQGNVARDDDCMHLFGKGEAQGSIAQDDDWTHIFGRVWVWQLVASDLLLLENQIPFFVLREIFDLLYSDSDTDGSKDALVMGSIGLFRSLCTPMLRRSHEIFYYHGVHHLLHLFYLSVAGPGPTPQPRESHNKRSIHQADDLPDHQINMDTEPATVVLIPPNTIHQAADVLPQWIPCAKELEEAGVRFRKAKDAKHFLDIMFDSRSVILEIPPLELYDFSDKLFRNLIAFEQTYPDTRCDITTYAVFMDCLINTPEDMRILHLRGILINQINGEQDATRFFSRFCRQVRYWSDKSYLKDEVNRVNKYRRYKPHEWRAYLVRNYFSNPWVTISVLAAGILLVLTILQTIFTGIATFNPPK